MPRANLDDLSTFILVADTGSMSAASRILQLTVNAVSSRMMRLEGRLGVRLFHRTTRRLSLTEEGRHLLDRSRRIVDELESVLNRLRPENNEISGVVRVGLPSGALSEHVFARLGGCLEAHPRLHIQIEGLHSPADVVSRGLDIGVVPGPLNDSRLVARRIGTVHWHLCASPAYLEKRGTPKSPKDLEHHSCLRLLSNPPQSEWFLYGKRGETVPVRIAGQFESDDSRVLGDAVYAGLGIGVRPAVELDQAIKARRLVRILSAYTFQPVEVMALFSRGRTKINRIAVVLNALSEALTRIS